MGSLHEMRNTDSLTLYHTIPTSKDPFNPLPDDKFSKLKEFADDNFKFDENGSKLSKQIENTVGKGEIARYEQFLLFPQCFLPKRLVSQGRQKVLLCGNVLKKAFLNMLGKGENDDKVHFLLCTQYFLPFPNQIKFVIHLYFVVYKCCQFRLV